MKVSVIIPCYNVENRVRDCLDSLVNQTIGTDKLELILVDDASTDGTVNVLKEYESRYPDTIMVILCEKNGRQGRARNIGMSYASGDWISFVDADDMIHHRMYEILCGIAEESAADLITLSYRSEPDFLNTEPSESECEYQVYEFASPVERKEFVLRGDLINNSCWQKFYRADLLRRAGCNYAEGVCYEEPLFTYPLRYFAERVAVTKIPLYYYHLNPDGTINQTMSDPSTIQDHLSVQLQLLEFMRKQDFYGIYKEEIELNFLHCFMYEPYAFLHNRGFELPESLIGKIRDMVDRHVPNWHENSYLDRIPELEREYILGI
ncbi:MAG: glycosyltransferase family 2 protein [Eubacterium sp.]|nr:glycosyltransferase family 2 protein [Eubacterium sp.]